MKKSFLYCSLLALSLYSNAQTVPTPKSFLGYEIGQQFTPHHKIVGYFEALAKAAPAQIKLEQYGKTNEGRPLVLAYIGSAQNISQLENIRVNNLKLAGAMEGAAGSTQTAIVWMSYNVHGNEASSSEAVMKAAYYLLTDAKAEEWLKNTLVILDPCMNPDGRDRYANWFNSVVGDKFNADPGSREHSEPWPGGRSNHYNFDLNRDWAWQTQVESQQRLAQYQKWLPQVHVDYHEQGFNEPYYFAPAAEPFHEVITPWQRQFQIQIGRNHAKYFDANGWLYFTKERFDLFYPSYGDTWPIYNGSIGMTYEQGGIRGGLGIQDENGDTLTLVDRAEHHFTTSISTVETASKNAADLLKNFQQFFANARSNGVGEYKTFVLKAKNSEGKLVKLQELLRKNGIEWGYANGGSAKGFNYNTGKDESFNLEKGDLLVSTHQTKGVLVKVLFEPNSKISDSATYDITAWSIPYVYGLNAYAVKEKLALGSAPVTTMEYKTPPPMTYGYLVSWKGMSQATFLAACLQKGIKPRIADKAFEYKGTAFPAGTLIFLKTSNKAIVNVEKTITDLAIENHITLVPVETGFMDKGVDFGSPDVSSITAPRVAVATGEGTNSLSAGEVWHFMERDLKYPVSMVNATSLANMRWSKYDILILPDGNGYRGLFEKDSPMKSWIQQGGKLIVIDGAAAQLARADWGLNAKKEEEPKAGDYEWVKSYGNQERDGLQQNNPGAIFKVALDTTHPLAFGYGDTYYTMKSDDVVYEFMKGGWNVGVMKKDAPVAGFVGNKAKTKLKDGVLFGELPMGQGSIIFMTDNVLFRNFWENGKLMMANALFMVH
ncbi:MAG TPA: M14 metallopeptidase family protein [Phnomibacter sp.]|nr:M14 metallopeptidase family protein [Phnomibacter sp.]